MDHYFKAFAIPILTAISILFAVVLYCVHAMLVISCDLVCLYNVQCYFCNYPSQACARQSTFAIFSFPLMIAVRIGITNALE